MARTFRGDELSALKTELTALSALERNMLADLHQLQERRAAESFNRTLTGALYVLLRRATGIYCIFRGFSVRMRRELFHHTEPNVCLIVNHESRPTVHYLAIRLQRRLS